MATTEAARPAIATAQEPSRGRARTVFANSVLPRIVLILGCLLFILPFYFMFASALKTTQEATRTPPTLIPSSWAWGNFEAAVNYIPFGLYAFNSTVITVGATIGAVL